MTNKTEVRVIEIDTWTGEERDVWNMRYSPWRATFTEEEAAKAIEWRRKISPLGMTTARSR